MARPKSTNVSVPLTITKLQHDTLQEHRWTARVERVQDVIAEAIDEYIANHGLTAPAEAAPEVKPAPKA